MEARARKKQRVHCLNVFEINAKAIHCVCYHLHRFDQEVIIVRAKWTKTEELAVRDMYSPRNDPDPEMIPNPEMIPKSTPK